MDPAFPRPASAAHDAGASTPGQSQGLAWQHEALAHAWNSSAPVMQPSGPSSDWPEPLPVDPNAALLHTIADLFFGGNAQHARTWTASALRVQELADYVADEDAAGAVRWLAPLLARAQTRTARIRLRGAARLLFSGYEHQAAAWVEQVRRLCALANALAGGDVNAMLAAVRAAHDSALAPGGGARGEPWAAQTPPMLPTPPMQHSRPPPAAPQAGVGVAAGRYHPYSRPVVQSQAQMQQAIPSASSVWPDGGSVAGYGVGRGRLQGMQQASVLMNEGRPTMVTATATTAMVRGGRPPRPQ